MTLRLAVIVDDESLDIYRAWTDEARSLMVSADKAINQLTEHLRRGVPPLWATIDPTVTIDNGDEDAVSTDHS